MFSSNQDISPAGIANVKIGMVICVFLWILVGIIYHTELWLIPWVPPLGHIWSVLATYGFVLGLEKLLIQPPRRLPALIIGFLSMIIYILVLLSF